MGYKRHSRGEFAQSSKGSVDGKFFKKWREEAGLSLREFCRRFKQKTGITLADSNLSAMEQGRRKIPDEVIAYGASILGKDPLDFPEYRLRQIPPEILTDPFADRILRMVVRMRELDEVQRAELRGSAKLLELMEEGGLYSTSSVPGSARSRGTGGLSTDLQQGSSNVRHHDSTDSSDVAPPKQSRHRQRRKHNS